MKDHLIIHCSATAPSQDHVDAEEIDRWHRQNGWLMCGYNEVITRQGQRQNAERGYRCRPLSRAGAHVGDCGPGWNTRSIGVCLVGGVAEDKKTPENNFTPAQMDALAEAREEYQSRFSIPQSHIMGHRDLIKKTGARYKACPSFSVREWLEGQPLEDLDDTRLRVPDIWETIRKSILASPTYTVRTGDTLVVISRATGVPLRDLAAINDIADMNLIRVGQVLRLKA